ncbi:MAG: crossover junction endodeoxyribonuclease RuvC [Phycisphaerae bacterium]|nr:crossover junction endodeoxyribonuclease RuvC [Phycisphaerae bacterium]
MPRLRLLGIDPGSSRTGYACVEVDRDGGAPTLVEAGFLRLSARRSLSHRLLQLERDLDSTISELRPDRIAVEAVFTHTRNLRTAIVLGHARGVVLLVAERHGLSLDEITPAAVKKAVTGNGAATKRQVQLAVASLCGLSSPPSPSDVSDAIAIALTAIRRVPPARR